MDATSDVTVLLPFEPVTATTGASAARAKSSMSPTIGTPRAAAACSAGSRTDTPGLTTISAAVSNTGASKPPHRISTSGNSDSTAGAARRRLARVHRDDPPGRTSGAGEVAHARQPGGAQPDHQHVSCRPRGVRIGRPAGVDGLMRVHAAVTES